MTSPGTDEYRADALRYRAIKAAHYIGATVEIAWADDSTSVVTLGGGAHYAASLDEAIDAASAATEQRKRGE